MRGLTEWDGEAGGSLKMDDNTGGLFEAYNK